MVLNGLVCVIIDRNNAVLFCQRLARLTFDSEASCHASTISSVVVLHNNFVLLISVLVQSQIDLERFGML